MRYNLIITDDAKQDISVAYLYYKQQESSGERFLAAIVKRLSDLSLHPDYYSFIDDRNLLRDVSVEPFPYLIIFEIISNDVIVFSVHLTYRQPQ